MRFQLVAAVFILCCRISYAQQQYHSRFPQQEVNAALQNAVQKSLLQKDISRKNIEPPESGIKSAFSSINKMLELKNQQYQNTINNKLFLTNDTVYVGDVPNDTLIITGNYTHTGPIFVFNDGVLIFHNATVIDTGDIYVFGHGRLFADSSSLTFPQQYFYERGLLAVQNGYVEIKNCSFNYSGFSHNLVVADSAVVILNSIHQNDWTTCGMFGSPSLSINGSNLGGEYILTDRCIASFSNVDTLILWHQFSDSAVINYSFPAGDTVFNYIFNNNVSGISGIGYDVNADSCHNVMWAIMQSNGSDITISNSVIRAIGAWFQRGDTVNVHGLFDNSSYTNFTAPLADRNLHLINTDVQTWSLYVFDSSHIVIDSCQLGEVGCQQRSSAIAADFLLDGSGGYFWATDTTTIYATNTIVYSTVRSERNGIILLAYSWLPFAAPSAIGNSLIVCVQNNLVLDPVPYDNSVAWMTTILQPDSAFVDTLVPVGGKAWIDQGPQGGWLFFNSYSLYYQLQGSLTWNVIVLDSLNEVHTGSMATWNTQGLTPGNYLLKLVVHNNFMDSVEAIKPITILPSSVGIHESLPVPFSANVFPNPSDGTFVIEISTNKNESLNVEIENILGEIIFSKKAETIAGRTILPISVTPLKAGIYFYRVISSHQILQGKVVVN